MSGKGTSFVCRGERALLDRRLQRPLLPVAVDLDRDGLEALRIEALDHGARGLERDLVLARAAARDDRDANLPAHGVVVVVGVVVSVVCSLNRPTVITTFEPGFAF